MSMWPSVQRGEQTWIFPYQEQADALFNTALVYEPAVLKRYIFPLLLMVTEKSPYYTAVRSVIKFLNYFQEADVEDEIPPTSILREFIGGNTFYGYKTARRLYAGALALGAARQLRGRRSKRSGTFA